MNLRRKQAGASLFGMLIIAIMVGFFVMCGIRMAPPYFEYLSIKSIISNISTEPDAAESSVAAIRRKLSNQFNTNQINHLDWKAVDVFRKEGRTYIDANYEVRVPIMGRIDAVINFDDLLFEVGSSHPVEGDVRR